MGGPGDAASDERIQDAITLAKIMRNNGASLEMIESRLVRRGFDGPAVEVVLRNVPKEEPNNIIVGPDSTAGGRKLLILIGLMISAVGLGLSVANRSGLAPTLPFLDLAIMVVGGVIMAAGRS